MAAESGLCGCRIGPQRPRALCMVGALLGKTGRLHSKLHAAYVGWYESSLKKRKGNENTSSSSALVLVVVVVEERAQQFEGAGTTHVDETNRWLIPPIGESHRWLIPPLGEPHR